jgi:O-antigen ligase
MAVMTSERPLLTAEEEISVPAVGEALPPRRSDRVAWWLYWSHLTGLTGISPSNILLGLTVLAAAPGQAVRSIVRRSTRPLLVVLAAYMAQRCISTLLSFDPPSSDGTISEMFSFCTLLLGLAFARGETAIRRLIDGVLLLATVESLIGLLELIRTGGPDLAHRIDGTLPHYMTFAGVLLVPNLFLLARVATRGLGPASEGGAGWRALALVPINAALLGCLTRSAWLGVAAGLVALLVVSRRRLLLWGLPAMLLFVLLFPEPVMQRMFSIADPTDATAADRVAMAKAGVEMIRERPLVGQGPGIVRERYPLFRQPDAVRLNVPHLHDAFLEIAAERGLPALACMLLLLALPVVRAARGYRREGGPLGARADIWLGVVAAVVGFAVAGLFEDNWGDAEVRRMLLLALALPYGLGSAEDEAERTAGATEKASAARAPESSGPRAVPRAV